jgi:hypothetical protein
MSRAAEIPEGEASYLETGEMEQKRWKRRDGTGDIQ